MKKIDLSQRFGFVVNEVGRLYGRQFDQLSREELGLSRAQCRLIGQVAYSEDGHAPTQAEIAQNLDLTPMAVATLGSGTPQLPSRSPPSCQATAPPPPADAKLCCNCVAGPCSASTTAMPCTFPPTSFYSSLEESQVGDKVRVGF